MDPHASDLSCVRIALTYHSLKPKQAAHYLGVTEVDQYIPTQLKPSPLPSFVECRASLGEPALMGEINSTFSGLGQGTALPAVSSVVIVVPILKTFIRIGVVTPAAPTASYTTTSVPARSEHCQIIIAIRVAVFPPASSLSASAAAPWPSSWAWAAAS